MVSPLGIGHESFWESLRHQRSGVDLLPATASTDLPLRIGAAIKEFDPKLYVKPRKALKVMSREIQTGFSAAALAVEQAAIQPDQLPSERMGVVFGSEMLYCEPDEMIDVYRRCISDGEFHFQRWGAASMSEMYPLWMLMYLPNMIACHIAIAHDARGPNNTICQGEVSSLLALIEAMSIIQRGGADVMIVGGSSSRLSLTPMLYRGVSRLSRNTKVPAQACRPFDATRDGMVNGEGAAAFVLESETHARARGAKMLARVPGWGMSFGSADVSPQTHVQAIGRSIEKTLHMAQLPATAVGHVNAHASGSVEEDAIEAQAIRSTLGDVPVTAPKSFFGNLGSSGGAVELVASLLAVMHGEIPVTLNFREADPACPVNVVHGEAAKAEHDSAVALSQSGTGQTVAVTLAGI